MGGTRRPLRRVPPVVVHERVGMPTTKLPEAPMAEINVSSQLSELVEFRKKEVQRLQHEAVLEQANAAQAKRQAEQMIVEAKMRIRDMDAETRQRGVDAEKALMAQQKALEFRALEVEARANAVAVLEAEAAPILAAKSALADERIAIEQQRVRNEALIAEGDRLSNANETLRHDVLRQRATVEQEETRLRALAADLDERQATLQTGLTSMHAELTNLTALKDTIDPKLAQVTELAEHADADHAQARLLREQVATATAELEKQRTDLASLSAQLQAKSESLLEFDARLQRKDAELRIKIQQAIAAGTTVAPVSPS